MFGIALPSRPARRRTYGAIPPRTRVAASHWWISPSRRWSPVDSPSRRGSPAPCDTCRGSPRPRQLVTPVQSEVGASTDVELVVRQVVDSGAHDRIEVAKHPG